MKNQFKELISLLNENNLTSIEYKEGDKKYKVSRENNVVTTSTPVEAGEAQVTPVGVCYQEIKSKFAGVYYSRLNPDADVLVKVGDVVEQGQVVAIIDSMKIMQEVKSEVSGKVVSINTNDGDIVTVDQVLFEVE